MSKLDSKKSGRRKVGDYAQIQPVKRGGKTQHRVWCRRKEITVNGKSFDNEKEAVEEAYRINAAVAAGRSQPARCLGRRLFEMAIWVRSQAKWLSPNSKRIGLPSLEAELALRPGAFVLSFVRLRRSRVLRLTKAKLLIWMAMGF